MHAYRVVRLEYETNVARQIPARLDFLDVDCRLGG